MKSPFPGMDPFLEGHLWSDVHLGLSFVIKEQLVPRVSPKYIVQTATYTVNDTAPEKDIGVMYPDVNVLITPPKQPQKLALPTSSKVSVLTPKTLSLPNLKPIEVKVPYVEIRDSKKNQLVTAIEILSPVNKRKPGLKPYQEKRNRLYQSDVHLLELDLLRRGDRVLSHPLLPDCHYLITLIRAKSEKTDIWALSIKDKLPIVPVPLKSPDADIYLDIGEALNTLYQRSQYQVAINYKETPPPPVFTEIEKNWIMSLFSG